MSLLHTLYRCSRLSYFLGGLFNVVFILHSPTCAVQDEFSQREIVMGTIIVRFVGKAMNPFCTCWFLLACPKILVSCGHLCKPISFLLIQFYGVVDQVSSSVS